MASRISVRFYSVEKLRKSSPSLRTALETISQEDHKDRQVKLSTDYVIRLERLDNDADEIFGEFIRVRDTDYPFEVKDSGVSRLQTDGPIGYGIAFRYRPSDYTFAIQYDVRIISPGRIFDYLMQYDNRFAYSFSPKLDAENWRKFNKFPVRKLRIGIASPQNLGAIEDHGAAVKSSLAALAEAYGAPVITVEMGMGNRKGALGKAARGAAAAVASLFQRDEVDLRSLKGWVKPEEGQPAEDLNLIDEILSEKTEFPSPKNDPEENYRIRSDILKRILNEHS